MNSTIPEILVDLIEMKLSPEEINQVFQQIRERSLGFITGLELHLRGRYGKMEVIIMQHELRPRQEFLCRSDFYKIYSNYI